MPSADGPSTPSAASSGERELAQRAGIDAVTFGALDLEVERRGTHRADCSRCSARSL